MKPTALAELIERQYYGGDVSDDAGLERIDFVEYVYAAYSYIVKLNYWGNIKNTGEREINNQYVAVYDDVAVEYDEKQDLYYSMLPTDPISLPNNIGIYQISKMRTPNKPFAPMGIGELYLFSGLPITQYTSDNNKVYYTNLDPNVKKVKMLIIPARPQDIHDDDVHEIKELVMKQMLTMRNIPEDKNNNSNPNIAQPNGQ